ncbi:DNA polymerase III subunit gamma and tau [Mobilicoccus massiliensis]|uniref:DNA polymerase III subunit gamma and tau n=1 Tax=Mobilicoccus massiliensis TaxID=1522310 RepID=UPI0006935263|nr:DNA polymerase III subunit gamma and tau [Mobilicoccus massiliensis]
MTTALYRRYRPQDFSEVIGQEHVTEPLMQALRSGRIGHAYLFSGPRGCGKTTSARILARCLNCEQGPTPTPCGECDSCRALATGGPGSVDVIEIDAASHGGVDDARDLREKAAYGPAQSRFKVYIIDEAHMVTPQGFNALLKIVEEPPEHVKFVFATTEPEKVIGTIRSRTHHYPFRLVPPARLQDYLEQLCEREGVAVEPGVLSFVVRAGGGSVRDSLSVLDQLIAGSDEHGLTYAGAAALLGFTEGELLDACVDAIAAGDGAGMFRQIDRVIETGQDPRRFVEDLLERFRDLIVLSAVSQSPDAEAHTAAVLRGLPDDQIVRMRQQAGAYGPGQLSYAADVINAGLTEMTGATSPRLQLELLCARLLLPTGSGEHGYAARLDRLERRLDVGGGIATSAPPHGFMPPAASSAPAGAGEDAAREVERRGDEARGVDARDDEAGRPHGRGDVTGGGRAAAEAPGRSGGPGAGRHGREEPGVPGRGAEARAGGQRPGQGGGETGGAVERAEARQGETRRGGQVPGAPAQGEQERGQGPHGPSAGGQRPVDRDTSGAPGHAGATGPRGGVDTEMIRRNWPDVLQRIFNIRRVTWTFLSEHAQVLDYDGNRLLLGLSTKGLATTFRNGPHGEVVRQALSEALGIDTRVEGIPASDAPAARGGGRPRGGDEPGDGGRPGGPGGVGPSGGGRPGDGPRSGGSGARPPHHGPAPEAGAAGGRGDSRRGERAGIDGPAGEGSAGPAPVPADNSGTGDRSGMRASDAPPANVGQPGGVPSDAGRGHSDGGAAGTMPRQAAGHEAGVSGGLPDRVGDHASHPEGRNRGGGDAPPGVPSRSTEHQPSTDERPPLTDDDIPPDEESLPPDPGFGGRGTGAGDARAAVAPGAPRTHGGSDGVAPAGSASQNLGATQNDHHGGAGSAGASRSAPGRAGGAGSAGASRSAPAPARPGADAAGSDASAVEAPPRRVHPGAAQAREAIRAARRGGQRQDSHDAAVPPRAQNHDDEVSADDEDIVDAGAVGQPVIATVLGGVVIAEEEG